ncbi:coiled-coil domain-containing protein 136 isoform X5 [Aquarana catesbeiana]|uniref:coiled-coil domain-containing protein 136 isoform X5 n=1 Tax=Aquarana catesbeiana TaxID=8400 RepID=UPI003CCA5843
MEDVDGQSTGRAQQITGTSPGSGGPGRWLPQPLTRRNHSYPRELLNGGYSEDEEPPDLESESGDVPSSSESGPNSMLLESQDLRTQIIQLLTELEETRELALKHEDSFLEMQGILEEERLASAQQAEIFTKQIQRLQAQLRSVQEEVDSLEHEKECELLEVSQELRCAQEEIMSLRQSAEEAAAERELQFLRDQCQHLQMERSILQESNSQLKSHLLLLGEEREGDADQGNALSESQPEQEEENNLKEENPPQYDAESTIALSVPIERNTVTDVEKLKLTREEERQKLHIQLQSAEQKVQIAQAECAGLLTEIEELQQRHQISQEEQEKLQEELRLCREEIHRLKESGLQAPSGSDPPVLSLPLLGLIVIMGTLWCWWAETS